MDPPGQRFSEERGLHWGRMNAWILLNKWIPVLFLTGPFPASSTRRARWPHSRTRTKVQPHWKDEGWMEQQRNPPPTLTPPPRQEAACRIATTCKWARPLRSAERGLTGGVGPVRGVVVAVSLLAVPVAAVLGADQVRLLKGRAEKRELNTDDHLWSRPWTHHREAAFTCWRAAAGPPGNSAPHAGACSRREEGQSFGIKLKRSG